MSLLLTHRPDETIRDLRLLSDAVIVEMDSGITARVYTAPVLVQD